MGTLLIFQKRVEVFLELYNSGTLQNTSIDVTNTNELIRLLDTVVIKLEDGNEEDYAILDKECKFLFKIPPINTKMYPKLIRGC